MTTLQRLRLYHAVLATCAVAAYSTGELGVVHAWLGYAVAIILILRVAWGLFGPRQIGISRLMPTLAEISTIRWFNHPAISKILLSGIIINLLLVTATGIAIDRFSSLGSPPRIEASAVIPPGVAEHDPPGVRRQEPTRATTIRAKTEREDEDDESEGWLGEFHEATANLLLAFVAMHVAYLLLFKRQLALFMLFRPISSPRNQ